MFACHAASGVGAFYQPVASLLDSSRACAQEGGAGACSRQVKRECDKVCSSDQTVSTAAPATVTGEVARCHWPAMGREGGLTAEVQTSTSASRETCQRIGCPASGHCNQRGDWSACIGTGALSLSILPSYPCIDSARRVVARESDRMRPSRKIIAGLGLAAGGYVLAAGLVAFAVPSDAARQKDPAITAPAHIHDHSHVDADQAEQLTGPFGAHGDRHPQAPVFETAADGLTERRRRTMSAQSGHFRAISASVLSDAGGEEMLQTHADALAALGGQIDTLFAITSPAPEGEKGALAAIWQKPELFAQYTAAYAEETARFAQTVREGGDLVNGLHDLRYYCVACHADFRQR